MIEENPIDKAKLISVIRNYENKKIIDKKNIIDFSVSPHQNNQKILIRTITQPQSHSGFVGIDTARKMIDFIKTKKYDKGIIIGNKFTKAAFHDLKSANIEIVSTTFTPKFPLDKLHTIVNDYAEKLCKEKCGKIPKTASDCKGIIDKKYDCKIRLISDNADFHYQKNWKKFLTQDIIQLIEIEKNMD